MSVGIRVVDCVNCSFNQVDIQGVDIGMEISNSVGVNINSAYFESSIAVKGRAVKGLNAKNVSHRFVPAKNRLAVIIGRIVHGYV